MSAIPTIAIFGEGYVNLLTIAQQVFTILHCSDFQPFSFVDMMRSQGVKETPCRNKPELFDYVYASSGEGPATAEEQRMAARQRKQQLREAQALCVQCPLRVECVAYALKEPTTHEVSSLANSLNYSRGIIYGGYSPRAMKMIFLQTRQFVEEYEKTGKTWFIESLAIHDDVWASRWMPNNHADSVDTDN